MSVCLHKSRRGFRSEIVIARGWGLPCGYWEPNLGPPQEHRGFPTVQPFCNWDICFLDVHFLTFLCLSLDTNPLLDVYLVKIFPHSIGCCFVHLSKRLALQKIFKFMGFHLLIIEIEGWTISNTVPIYSRICPTFTFIRLSVSDFMLKTLILLDLRFLQA